MSLQTLDAEPLAVAPEPPMEARARQREFEAGALEVENAPWLPPTGDVDWQRFESFADELAARIVAGRLEFEGVPTFVDVRPDLFGRSTASVHVPASLMHRARWLKSLAFPTEAELTFLATGELPASDAR